MPSDAGDAGSKALRYALYTVHPTARCTHLNSCTPPTLCICTHAHTPPQEYREGKDLVIIEGTTVDGIGNLTELNGRFAAEMGAPVLMVG